MTFELYDDELVKFLTDSEVYVLKNNNKIVGCGKINKDNNNKLEVYVLHEFRGNKYGKLIFEQLLGKIEDEDNIKVTFKDDNIKFKKIVEDFGGEVESISNGFVKYVIPTKAT